MIYLDRPDIPAEFLRAFPSYNGKKFQVVESSRIELQGTYWSGGSKSTYRLCSFAGEVRQAPVDSPFDGNGTEGTTWDIPPGYFVAEHVIFCGKDLGLRFYVRPDNMTRLIGEAPGADLSEAEREFLVVLRTYRSCPERKERLAKCGVDRDVLKASGYIKVAKNGATSITTKGRNV